MTGGKYDLSKLYKPTETLPDFNQKEVRAQIKEQTKPEIIKKTDQKIKELDDQIVNVSRDWTSLKKAQETNAKTLTYLENQYNDPMIPEDAKIQISQQYNQVLQDSKATDETTKKIREQAIGLQKSKSALNKIYDIQNKLDMDTNDDVLKATGNFLTHVYNAIPETISGAGSLLESVGDIVAPPSSDIKDLYQDKDNKITDAVGGAIREMGNNLKSETDAKYDDKHYISSTIGDIVGSIAVSAIPGSMAAKSGKVAQVISGATTATMQTADQIHNQAKELGLSDNDAGLMTLAVAPVSGLLEVWGASNIIDNISGKKIIKELVDNSIKDLSGKTVTKEVIFNTVSDQFKEVAKKYGKNIFKSSVEEGVTEAAQGELQAAAENIYDESQGKKVYGTEFFSGETQLDVAKQAALGAAAGGVFGVLSGISSPKNLYEKAIELKSDPEKLSKFRDMLNTEVEAGHITPEKANNIKYNINAIIKSEDRIPSSIKKVERRVEAINLLAKRDKLEAQIEGKDKALTIKQREKIDAINSDLEALASGKKIVKMERKEIVPQDLTQKPKTNEKAEETQKTVLKKEGEEILPLTQEEQDELEVLEGIKENLGNKIPKEDNLRLIELKTKQNAVRIDKPSSVLQYSQEGTGKPGSERGGMEQIIKGTTPSQKSEIQTKVKEKITGNEKTNKAIPESSKSNSEEIEGSKTKTLGVGNRIPKAKRKLSEKATKALSVEANSAYDKALQYFVNRKQLHPSAIEELYGGPGKEKAVGKEKQARMNILHNEGKTIEQIAHHLWEVDNRFNSQEYRDAVEQVINEHNSTGSMMDELLRKNDIKHEMSEDDQAYYDMLDKENKDLSEDVQDYWNDLTDEEREYLSNESDENIEKFFEESKPTKSDLKKNVKEKKSEADSAENKYQKAKSALEEKGTQDQLDIFGQTKADEMLFKNDLSEQRKIVNELKNKSIEAKKEYESAKNKLDSFVEPNQLEIPQEEQKSLADKIRSGKLKGGTNVGIPGFNQVWNGTLEVIAKAVEGGVAIKDAIEKGIEYLKNTDYYKSKSKVAQDTLEKNIRNSVAESQKEEPINEGKIPQKSTSKRIAALASELSEADNIPKSLQNKIKEFGLKKDVFSHQEAKEISNSIIDSQGVEGAIELANSRLKGSVKAFVYGAAIDYYSNKIKEAKTPEEKENYAELGAEVSEMFESNAEDYGRFISAIGEYYKNHPDIIKKRIANKLNKDAQKNVGTISKEKIDQVQAEFEKLKSDLDNKIQEGVEEEINKINESLSPEKKKASDKAIAALEKFRSKIRSASYSDATGIVAAVDSAITLIIRAIKVGRSVSDAIELGVKHINKKMEGEKWDEASFRKDMEEGFKSEGVDLKTKVDKTTKEKQEAILNKAFPKKRLESETKRKKLHEKIIDQYNAGVFQGGVNKEGVPFESLFYEKLGIIDPNSKEVQDKIGEFAEKMSKAKEGSIMWRETNQDMLNYLANLAYETKLKATGDKLSAMWYANILSSPATHLRNLQFNIIQTMIAQPLLMAQKEALKGDVKAAASVYANLFRGLSKGLTESGRVMSTGKGTRFDVLQEAGITDRGSKWMKFFSLPGRALRASDILFTEAGYTSKMGEIARNLVKSENPDWNESQVNSKVNELLGQTKERMEDAKIKAEKELEEFYGPDWKNVKDIKVIQKIREFELMEESMPPELQAKKEEAMQWAKRSVLTNKPPGVYGQISDFIQKMNRDIWFTKFIMPFVNVPLNVVNGIIERSPVGLIKAWRGKEGFGAYATELTKDQKQELLIKATNYTIALATLALINGDDDDDDLVITGDQTGNYTDNKGIVRGGKLEPYSVYIDGKKVLNYKTSPWAAVLMPVGYMRDYKVYGENKSKSDEIANVAINYLLFTTETSAMMGMAGMFEAVSNAKKINAETTGKSLAKLASGFIPYSGGIKYLTNTINAATGEKDRRPIDWYENVYRDIPFAQTAIRIRKDHFGQPIRETFDVPLLPVGDRGLLKEISEKSPYYKMTSDHKYNPQWTEIKKIDVDGETKSVSLKEADDINARRGELVKEALDSKNVFVLRNPNKKAKESEMTTMEYLNGLDNDDFKVAMDRLFSDATKYAKLEKFGSKLGISKKDIVRFNHKLIKLKESGYDVSTRKNEEEKKNLKEIESFKDKGGLVIPVDDYFTSGESK